VEPSGPIPEFIVRRASKLVLNIATEQLRQRIMGEDTATEQQ